MKRGQKTQKIQKTQKTQRTLRRSAIGLAIELGLAVVLAIAPGTSARGNMASPQFPGDAIGEPIEAGVLEETDSPMPSTNALSSAENALSSAEIDVLGETLTIDFRPLDDRTRLINIEAIYRLDNPGQAGTTELLFVAPRAEAIEVQLDGTPLVAEPITVPLPDTWQPPEQVPLADRTDTLSYETRSPATFRFAADLPTGEATIAVRYTAVPGTYDTGVYRDYQIGYVLAPIRDWRSFGGLDIIVRTPPRWLFGSSVLLTGENGEFRGEFETLPDDTLGMAVSPPRSGWRYVVTVHGGTVGWWLGLVASGVMGIAIGRFARTRRTQLAGRGGKVAVAIVGAVAGGVAFGVCFFGSVSIARQAQIGHEAGNWQYGRAVGMLFATTIGLGASLLTGLGTALLQVSGDTGDIDEPADR